MIDRDERREDEQHPQMPAGDEFIDHYYRPELISPTIPEWRREVTFWGVVFSEPRDAGRARRAVNHAGFHLQILALVLLPIAVLLLFVETGHDAARTAVAVAFDCAVWLGLLLRLGAHLWPRRAEPQPAAPEPVMDYESLAARFDELGAPDLAQLQRDLLAALRKDIEEKRRPTPT